MEICSLVSRIIRPTAFKCTLKRWHGDAVDTVESSALFQHPSVCVSQASAEPVEKEEPFLLPAQAYKPKNWAAANRSRKERWEEQRFSRVDCPWNWTSVLKLLHWRGRYGLKDIACCRPQAASKVQGLGRILLRNLSCHTLLCTELDMMTLFPLTMHFGLPWAYFT